jgi:hypothetical protein
MPKFLGISSDVDLNAKNLTVRQVLAATADEVGICFWLHPPTPPLL